MAPKLSQGGNEEMNPIFSAILMLLYPIAVAVLYVASVVVLVVMTATVMLKLRRLFRFLEAGRLSATILFAPRFDLPEPTDYVPGR